ncbi:SRPBCC family protein [Pusillimonas sp.]|uniref:aromatic ring-hydroxylating oxygenase subunit alpha n=1 Tax=Pusillimonas sp. TaxID=3040095 RepID=UPI0037CAF5FC
MKLSDLKDIRWTLNHPELGTGPVTIESYSSPEYFAQMREKVFKKVWMATAKRVDEIPKPGDYFVETVDITNDSIIIVRGLDGVIRGFHNVCKHRGTRVVNQDYGNVRGRFTCIYHGWSYGLDGKNILVTEKDMFFDTDKMEADLIPVAVDEWKGFIFFNLDPQPEETLAEYLGPELISLYEDYPFEQTTVRLSYNAHLDTSWPVMRDSQLEGYHLKYLHRRSAPGFMESEEAPSRHAWDFKLLGKHNSGSFYGNLAQITAELPETAAIATLANQTALRTSGPVENVPLEQWSKGVNPTRTANWFFDILYIFPNLHFVFLGPCAYIVHKMMPGEAHNKSSWNGRFFAPPVDTAGLAARWAVEYKKYRLRDLWREDGNTALGAQKSIDSGVFKLMYLQDQELLIRHAEKVLNDMVHDQA